MTFEEVLIALKATGHGHLPAPEHDTNGDLTPVEEVDVDDIAWDWEAVDGAMVVASDFSLSPSDVDALAAAMDEMPARWAHEPQRALRAGLLLRDGDYQRLPHFLWLVSECFPANERRMLSLWRSPDDLVADDEREQRRRRNGTELKVTDDGAAPGTLMGLRRLFEARALAAAIDSVDDQGDPNALIERCAQAVSPPDAVGDDSGLFLAARLLDTLATENPAAFGRLAAYLEGELGEAVREGPLGWAVDGFQERQRRRREAVLAPLRSLAQKRAWDELVVAARAALETSSDDPEVHTHLVAGLRFQQAFDDARDAARAGLRRFPRDLALVDISVAAMMFGGHADEALHFWHGCLPPLGGEGAATLRERAQRHLAQTPENQRHVLANTCGNVLAAFAATERYVEAVQELAAYIEGLPDTSLLHGNAACIFAQAGDVDAALDAMARAIKAGKPKAFFETDGDLDSLRDLSAFKALLAESPSTAPKPAETVDETLAQKTDSDSDVNAPAPVGADPEAVPTLLEELCSTKVARVRHGLHALRQWVRSGGDEVPLNLFGVAESGEHLVSNELFDGIVDGFGAELGSEALLNLVGSLFNGDTRFHNTAAALKASRLLLSIDDDNDSNDDENGAVADGNTRDDAANKTARRLANEEGLVDIFQAACAHYEDGHRFYSDTVMDAFIDEIFPTFQGPPLVRLLLWAWADGPADDLDELLEPALATFPVDEATLLDAFAARAHDADGTHLVDAPGLVARLEPLLQSPMSDGARRRLEALRGEAVAEMARRSRVTALLHSVDVDDLEMLLRELGDSIPARLVAADRLLVDPTFALRHGDIDGEVFIAAISRLGDAPALLAPVARLAVERDPAATLQELNTLLRNDAHRKSVRDAIVRANDPDLFAPSRRALRQRGVFACTLPHRAHPALRTLQQKF